MKASLTNYRQAPRKVRLVANLIKGKSVEQALDILAVANKRASTPLEGLLKSAIANAKALGMDALTLMVKECSVDSGMTMKRHMPGSRGRGFPIKKHTSHVHIVLGVKEIKAPRKGKKTGTKVEAKSEKKAKTKAIKETK